MKLSAFILFICFLWACKERTEQESPTSPLHVGEWAKYDFTSRIKSFADSTRNFDQAAVIFSNSGNYFAALEVFDRSYAPPPAETVYLDSSRIIAVPAIDHIVQEALKYRVVIINEAHHVSYTGFSPYYY